MTASDAFEGGGRGAGVAADAAVANGHYSKCCGERVAKEPGAPRFRDGECIGIK
jgi:hypothetical protein